MKRQWIIITVLVLTLVSAAFGCKSTDPASLPLQDTPVALEAYTADFYARQSEINVQTEMIVPASTEYPAEFYAAQSEIIFREEVSLPSVTGYPAEFYATQTEMIFP